MAGTPGGRPREGHHNVVASYRGLGSHTTLTVSDWSQTRRARILEATWGKFKVEFKSSDTLFGKDFQSSLTDKVETDVALSKEPKEQRTTRPL